MKSKKLSQWAHDIMQIKDPETYADTLRFNRLLDEVEQYEDISIARILFGLLSNKEDYGVKQGVVRVLSGYCVYKYYTALIMNLPRTLRACTTKDWPQSPIGYWGRDITEADMPEIYRAYKDSPPEEREVFLRAICEHDYFHENLWPSQFLNYLKKESKNDSSS